MISKHKIILASLLYLYFFSAGIVLSQNDTTGAHKKIGLMISKQFMSIGGQARLTLSSTYFISYAGLGYIPIYGNCDTAYALFKQNNSKSKDEYCLCSIRPLQNLTVLTGIQYFPLGIKRKLNFYLTYQFEYSKRKLISKLDYRIDQLHLFENYLGIGLHIKMFKIFYVQSDFGLNSYFRKSDLENYSNPNFLTYGRISLGADIFKIKNNKHEK